MSMALRHQAHGLELAFSTRAAGDLRDPPARALWLRSLGAELPRAVLPGQVHATRVVEAGDTAGLAGADGVVSTDPALALGVYGADCPGLVLRAGAALGVAHCGWRGCAGGIVSALLAALARLDPAPIASYRALIGPGICGACYEVDAPVIRARVWPAAALQAGRGERVQLDLRTAIAADLQQAGVENVQVWSPCTACDPRLHSYRHQGAGCSQLLLAWRSGLA